MFQGEKTSIFWIGLLLLSISSVALFAIVWTLLSYPYSYGTLSYALSSYVPIIVGALVFILVGLYMMKSGVKKTASGQPSLPTA